MPSIKKARSSVKKRMKKAMVERRVQMRRMVVKMNQPWCNECTCQRDDSSGASSGWQEVTGNGHTIKKNPKAS